MVRSCSVREMRAEARREGERLSRDSRAAEYRSALGEWEGMKAEVCKDEVGE